MYRLPKIFLHDINLPGDDGDYSYSRDIIKTPQNAHSFRDTHGFRDDSSRGSTPSYKSNTGYHGRSAKRGRRISDLSTKQRRRGRLVNNSNEDHSHNNMYVTLHMDFSDCEEVEIADAQSDSASHCDSLGGENEENQTSKIEEESSGTSLCRKPIVPDFHDSLDIPHLSLPQCSADLFVEKEFLMQLLEIYEVLRRFHRVLRLTRFRFEDFFQAIKSSIQSTLLAEIHVCLMKLILRADDSISAVYGPLDLKDSVNILFYTLDYMSWYEIIRSYVSSGFAIEYENAFQLLHRDGFFSNSVKERLLVLQCLTDLFLTTSYARDEITKEGSFQHEDQCRFCYRLGDLICCELCPAVYHLECVGLEEVPQGDWICDVCKLSEVTGVTDCLLKEELEGPVCRLEPLGYDRHLRRYWFLCRSIIVESDDEVFCYDTKDKFEALLQSLDKEYYESYLYATLSEMQNEIFRQMEITLKIDINSGNVSTFQSDSTSGKESTDKQIHKGKDCSKASAGFNHSSAGQDQANCDEHTFDMKKPNSDSTCSDYRKMMSSLRATSSDSNIFSLSTKMSKSQPTDGFASSSFAVGKDGVKKCKNVNQVSSAASKSTDVAADNEGCHFEYENLYSTNVLALSRHQHIEEKEKRRHLSYKFSIPLTGEFHWCGQVHGSQSTLVNTFKNTLLQLESYLPMCLLHPMWRVVRSRWLKMLDESSNIRELSRILVDFQSCIKPVVFNHIWHEALGHTILKRICTADKEEAKRRERESRRMRVDEDDVCRSGWIKYSLGVKHQLWKVKGEEYRADGSGGWIWISASRISKYNPASELGLRRIANEMRAKMSALKKMPKRQNGKTHSVELSHGLTKNDFTDEPDVEDLDSLRLSGNFSVTDSLLDKAFYRRPKMSPPASRLDDLLERRLKQVEEDKKLSDYFHSLIAGSSNESERKKCRETCTGVAEVSDQCKVGKPDLRKITDSNNFLLKKKEVSFNPGLKNCAVPANNFSLLNGRVNPCRRVAESNCDLSKVPLAALLQEQKLPLTDEVISRIQTKLVLLSQTRVRTMLGKKESSSRADSQESPKEENDDRVLLPRTILSQCHKSLFALESSLSRTLARKEGKIEVPGFSYNCKMTNVNWPYPSARPLFKTAWQHRTQAVSSLAALASQLRIMWACLRWDNLSAKIPSTFIHTVTKDNGITSTEVLRKRDVGKDGMKSEFLLRKIVVPLVGNSEKYSKHEKHIPQRSGLRERKKSEVTVLKDPIITESWVPDETVELWQIKHFAEEQEKENSSCRLGKTKREFIKKIVAEEGVRNVRKDAYNESTVNHDVKTNNVQVEMQYLILSNQDGTAAQQIKIIMKKDGNIEIHGLKQDQQIIQLPNGNIHIATLLPQSSSEQENSYVLGPQIYLPVVQNQPSDESNSSEQRKHQQQQHLEKISHTSDQSIIPACATLVTPQFLQQVISQALTQTPNLDVREKLLAMQKIIQQQIHSGGSCDAPSDSISHHNNTSFSLSSSVSKTPRSLNAALSQEEKEEQSRMFICAQVVRHMLDAVERNERMALKNTRREELKKNRMRQMNLCKLEAFLQRKKEALRRDMLHKRNVLESAVREKIQSEIDREKELPRQNIQESCDSTSTSKPKTSVKEQSKLSPASSLNTSTLSQVSESEASTSKRKRHKSKSISSDHEELYCICRTPYDSSKFYIGCDHCQNWFHGSCVGITKSDADRLDTYCCPNCKQTSSRSSKELSAMTDILWKEVEKVVADLKVHKNAWPFLQPVNAAEVPDYYSVITEPMDLSTLENKIRTRRYNLLSEFISDTMKIFDNCRYYNSRNTKFYKCAEILDIYFSGKLRSLKSRLKIS